MARPVFNIELNDQSVKVRLISSEGSPRGRFHAFFSNLVWLVLALCLSLFIPGKYGTSVWHELSSAPVDSGLFRFVSILMLGIFALVIMLSWEYWVAASPSDQTICCDRSTLTVSTVRWLDIHNKDWDTRSYALEEITKMKYDLVACAKGGAVYGLCFTARGKTHAVLPGVKPRAADKILKALKALGVNVPEDPKLATILAESASIPDSAL
jgi:hypothetical protein